MAHASVRTGAPASTALLPQEGRQFAGLCISPSPEAVEQAQLRARGVPAGQVSPSSFLKPMAVSLFYAKGWELGRCGRSREVSAESDWFSDLPRKEKPVEFWATGYRRAQCHDHRQHFKINTPRRCYTHFRGPWALCRGKVFTVMAPEDTGPCFVNPEDRIAEAGVTVQWEGHLSCMQLT